MVPTAKGKLRYRHGIYCSMNRIADYFFLLLDSAMHHSPIHLLASIPQVEPLTQLPGNLQEERKLYALQGPQAGVELSLLARLCDLRTVDQALMECLLGKQTGLNIVQIRYWNFAISLKWVFLRLPI